MSTLRTIKTAAVLALSLGACAQVPGGTAAAPPTSTERMAAMDVKMKSMHEMHDKMSRARTPEERQALMAEHMKLMHEGMATMDGMPGRYGMGGMGGMGGIGGMGNAPTDMPGRMQMMMDQMAPPPAKR